MQDPTDLIPLGKPHVAFVLPGLRAGGSEHIVSLVCNRLAERGWAVTLFAFENPGASPYYAHDRRVRVVQLGCPERTGSLLAPLKAVRRRIAALRKALRLERPDLLVSFLTRTNVVAVLAAGPLDIPVLVSERNNPEQQRPGPIWSALRGYTYRRAVGLVTMTRGAMQCFPAAMRRREWVIPNPCYAPISVDPDRPCGNRIVAVGRLTPQKGFDLLLQAFARIEGKHPDWNLVIWGEGKERAALEALRNSLNLDGRVSLPGCTEKPGQWIADADIFVLSSRFEGWGIVVGEAMAAGLPVVSFDCRFGPAEMIEPERNGLIVPDGDVGALAGALDRLCSDPALRERLAVAARSDVRRFDKATILQQWQDTIESLLPAARKPEPSSGVASQARPCGAAAAA